MGLEDFSVAGTAAGVAAIVAAAVAASGAIASKAIEAWAKHRENSTGEEVARLGAEVSFRDQLLTELNALRSEMARTEAKVALAEAKIERLETEAESREMVIATLTRQNADQAHEIERLSSELAGLGYLQKRRRTDLDAPKAKPDLRDGIA